MAYKLITGSREHITGKLRLINKVHSMGYLHDDNWWVLQEEPKKQAVVKENVMEIERPLWLENIYDQYPRKMGKKAGFEAIIKRIKDGENPTNLLKAIGNFIIHVNGKEKKFIPYFSTFINQYLDDFMPGVYKAEDKFGFLNEK